MGTLTFFRIFDCKGKNRYITYLVKIPNKEISTFFKNLFVDIVFRGSNNIGDMKQALHSKDILV